MAWRERSRREGDRDRQRKNPLLCVGEILVASVQKGGEGLTADRRPWTLWIVQSSEAGEYRTFDAVIANHAFEAIGRRAAVEWEFNGYGRELKSLRVLEEATF